MNHEHTSSPKDMLALSARTVYSREGAKDAKDAKGIRVQG